MKRITSDEWSEEIGSTQIFLRRDNNINRQKPEFELVICDRVDSHSKFYLYGGDLNTVKQIGSTIEKLVAAANERKKT